jgi:hypothetical protein
MVYGNTRSKLSRNAEAGKDAADVKQVSDLQVLQYQDSLERTWLICWDAA